MRINWNNLFKNIPSHIRVAPRTIYELLFIKGFNIEDTAGETRFDERQFVIKQKQSIKETVLTVSHEFWHGLSYEHEINLTEEQVIKLEQAFPYIQEFFLELNKRKTK